ncbi:2700_t:CDS:2 [Acaulospora colombiana]|uniref:2700_t:CDS:1 n=1 Tax=Acaulospora colombiana TaxID=27376 RepID=A0ACA9NAE9_9GLOM|nr:2700_t:CDS:2 [Acaulospora colombiana]
MDLYILSSELSDSAYHRFSDATMEHLLEYFENLVDTLDVKDYDVEYSVIPGKNDASEVYEDDNFIMDADYLPGGERYDETKDNLKKSEKKRLEKEEKKKVKRKFDEYLDEYYQLDYEDIIGDTPVRFKYRQTKPLSFGLTSTEILLSDEKDLNEFVSIKKLAPFRPEHLVANDIKKYSKKKRLQQFRQKLELSEINNPPEDKAWSIKSIVGEAKTTPTEEVKSENKPASAIDSKGKKRKKKKKKARGESDVS